DHGVVEGWNQGASVSGGRGTEADFRSDPLVQSFYQGKALYQRQQGKPSLWQRFLNHLSS
ncbi:hypothetical protein K6U61_12435, partial [Vibrio vulnificus]|nr:hypothetical protein [Vibrio vulnificus]